MKKTWALIASACALGLLVAAHIYFFLRMPKGVAIGSGAGIVAAIILMKVLVARIGIHRLLRRIH